MPLRLRAAAFAYVAMLFHAFCFMIIMPCERSAMPERLFYYACPRAERRHVYAAMRQREAPVVTHVTLAAAATLLTLRF